MKNIFPVLILLFIIASGSAEIAPELEEELDNIDTRDSVEVLVTLDTNNESFEQVDRSNLSEYDLQIEEEYSEFETILMEVSASEIENVSEEEFVYRIEPDYEVEALLAESSVQIGSRVLQSNNSDAEDVSVAIMDSGVANHSYLELESQRDFTGEGLGDDNGHGTHVAGIVGSRNSDYAGVANGAKLYDAKVLDSEGRGRASSILLGLEHIIRSDVDVAVMSLGTTVENCNGNDALSRAVGEAVRRGVVVAASAGNAGPSNGTLTAPGCSERALTVGAVDKSDNIASYSSRGPTSDGRNKPDVVAPGSSIISTSTNNDFVSMSGTSMAAPQVAGQAALIISKDSEKNPSDVKSAIKNSADDIGYPKNVQGAGRINIPESLNATTEIQTVEENSILSQLIMWLSEVLGF